MQALPASRAAGSRYAWLDTLRGLAATAVVIRHLGLYILTGQIFPVVRRFDLGVYGVMLFFLVSGYIIPASLERRGSVQAFWVGRVFRIYPLVILTVVATALIVPRGYTVLEPATFQHPWLSTAANGMLLQDLLGMGNSLPVLWTLCYEMVFYFMVTALFMYGWHRRSAEISVGFAAAALVVGASLPALGAPSAQDLATQHRVLAVAVVFVPSLLGLVSGIRTLQLASATVLAGTGLWLVTHSARTTGWESLTIFATMFAGTVIYRAERGQISKAVAWACALFVFTAAVTVGALYNRTADAHYLTWTNTAESWCTAIIGAWLTFGIGMLLRHRRVPRPLAWLGEVSFSVYILHTVLISVMVWVMRDKVPNSVAAQAAWAGGYLVVFLIACWLTYRLVEMPMLNVGKRVARWLADRDRPRPDAPDGPDGSSIPDFATAGRQVQP